MRRFIYLIYVYSFENKYRNYDNMDNKPKVGRPSKLTKEQIDQVKKLTHEGMGASQISALIGIPRPLVYSQMYKEKKKVINKNLYLRYKSEGKILSGLRESSPEKYEMRLKYTREYQRDRKRGIKKSDIKEETKPIILPAPKTAREIRGLEISKRQQIVRNGIERIVPSESGSGTYIVRLNMNIQKGEMPFRNCTCRDFELTGNDCKHILAVMYSEMNYQKKAVLPTEKKQSQQNWNSYNYSQTHEKDQFMKLLADLCQNIENQSFNHVGRHRLPLKDVVFSSALKVYTTFSLRRFISDMRFARDKGYIGSICSYSSVSNYMRDKELTPILQRLIVLSSLPLRNVESKFAVDGTGFRTTTFTDYCREKHNTVQQHEWVKAHIICGVKTNVVTGIEITDSDRADSPQFIPLLEKTANSGFNIEEVSADKAYSGRKNLSFVDKLGGIAFIPYKSNATGRTGGSPIWRKMFDYFIFNREDFLEHYHLRSNIESTNYMIKSKFMDFVRSKDSISRTNEVLLKIFCHNIVVLIHEMNELGIDLDLI